MKKAKSPNRSSLAKREGAPTSVGDYFVRLHGPGRIALNKMREAIRSAVPRDTTETISYGIPAFKGKEVLVWYAAFSDHCSLFPTASVIEAFEGELKDFSKSKGTIHFPLDKPLPIGLIQKIVKARVAQVKAEKR